MTLSTEMMLVLGLVAAHRAGIKVVGVADHILGAMRDEVWHEDILRRPFFDPKFTDWRKDGKNQVQELHFWILLPLQKHRFPLQLAHSFRQLPAQRQPLQL